MRKLTKFLAVVTALNMFAGLLPTISNAAADPTVNTVISNFSSNVGQHGGTYPAREIVSYGGRENVVHYNYVKGTQTANTIYFPNDQSNTGANKKLSFEFLLHNATIPYEVRLLTTENRMIGEFQLNFYGSATAIPTGTTVSRFGVAQTAGKALVNGRTINVSNDEWHTCEAVMDENGTSFYVDGAYVDRTKLTDFVSDAGFIGVQVVQRATNQSQSVSSDDGVYFDNIKTCFYDENSQFYGEASYDGEYVVTVDLSESINSTFIGDFSDVELINTNTGESISLDNVVKTSPTQFVINSFFELEEGTEYKVKMPVDLKGISGKDIYSDVYFTPTGAVDMNRVQVNDDFSSYADTITSVQGNMVSCAPEQFGASYVSFNDIGGEHGKVLTVNRRKNNGNKIRFGVAGPELIDVSLGTATIEFDIRVLDNAGFNYFAIQPYSVQKDGVSDKSELTRAQWTQGNGAALGTGRTMDKYNTQMCNMFILTPSNVNGTSQQGNVIIQARYQASNDLVIDNRPAHIMSPVSGNNVNMNVGNDWHHVKITINHTGATPKTTYQLDNGSTYTSTVANNGTYGSEATDLLCGVRFCEIPADQDDDFNTPMVQFDNFKISGPVAPNASVKKIRVYNPNGEEFGPLSTEISPSANTAKVFFTDSVDISAANITVSNGADIVDSEIGAYNSRENSVTITLNETLLKGTQYTINVEGVKTTSGMNVKNASAAFTTTDKGEFLIEGLRLTDASGNTLTNTLGMKENDTVYVAVTFVNTLDTSKDAVVIGSVYNSQEMQNLNYKKYVIAANSKVEVVNEIPLTVSDINDLSLAAMIWDDFDSVRPLCDAVVLVK